MKIVCPFLNSLHMKHKNINVRFTWLQYGHRAVEKHDCITWKHFSTVMTYMLTHIL